MARCGDDIDAIFLALLEISKERPNTGPEEIKAPEKITRIASMARQLLHELRESQFDAKSRVRVRQIYNSSLDELATMLGPEISSELDRLSIPFDAGTPTRSELQAANAQLLGWLDGLVHGIQARLVADRLRQARVDEASISGAEKQMASGSPYL